MISLQRRLANIPLLSVLFCVTLQSVADGASSSQPTLNKNPNIILILADDLGYGDIGANGSKISTPNIDYLATSGIQFNSFYASANVCTPSRAGLLTGRYPIRTGLAYGVIAASHTHGLKKDEITLAEILNSHGYRTSIIGKWHLGHQPEHWPTQHGFDHYFGLPYSNDQTPLSLYRGQMLITDEVDQTQLTNQYTEEIIKVIKQNNDAPFFVFLSHTFPHVPLHVPDNFSGISKAGLYGDVVEHLDWGVGEIIQTLQKTNKLNNTLIIVTSDNGPWFEGSAGPYRNGKGSTWEGAYRVPFIMWWPAVIPASKTDAMAMNIDVLPTVLGATNIKIPQEAKIDGKNLMPLVLGKTDKSPHEYLLFFNNEEVVGVRSQAWKLLTRSYYRKDFAAFDKFYGYGYWLLWDMQDPQPERYSMADRQPNELNKLKKVLANAIKEFEPLRTREPMAVRY